MPHSEPKRAARLLEAERLIGLARAMLSREREEMAIHYLDHAVAALHEAAPAGTTVSP